MVLERAADLLLALTAQLASELNLDRLLSRGSGFGSCSFVSYSQRLGAVLYSTYSRTHVTNHRLSGLQCVAPDLLLCFSFPLSRLSL